MSTAVRPVLCRLAAALLVLAAPAALAGPVETTLSEALLDSMEATVPAGARITVTLGTPFTGTVEAVREISYDPRTGTFRAMISSDGRVLDLGGRADIEVEMPVPAHAMQPGDVIEAADLTMIRVPLDRTGDGFVTTPDALIGMSPRRRMAAGRLIRAGTVGAPVVVQRNRPVTLVFEDGPLLLAARGRALQDGGIGDVVRVMNISSSAVVTGTITGAQTVSVNGPRVPQRATANAVAPLP